jgi:hypothetical protein
MSPVGSRKAVHDSAQGRFVDAQHSRQAVLPDARGVHPQLQVRINVSIQGHGFALVFYSACSVLWGAGEAVTAKHQCNPSAKAETLFVNILL